MKKSFKTLIILFFWMLIPFSLLAQAERIISFNSLIRVHTDAGITVSEEIKVYAGGAEIKRGIFRSLPVKYVDYMNNNYTARYDILAVLRDGNPEPYHIKYEGDFMVIYIGDEDVFLEPGEYTYTISYYSPRQIRFFQDYDELYWNVTGNQWGFTIEQASATVKMPYPVSIKSQSGYTGYFGEQGKDYVMSKEANGDIVCTATRILAGNEGLSFAFSFPKGIINEPTSSEKFGYYLQDNKWSVIAVIILLLVAVYFIFAWFKVGRDPAKGAIPVLYYPPDDLSPGAMRFIYKMGFDNKAFTAGIIQLAVKNFLSIQDNSGEYTLKNKENKKGTLCTEEKKLYENLLANRDVLVLKNTNHTTISAAISSFKESLKDSYQKANFFPNFKWFAPGLLGTILAIIIMIVGLFSGGSVGMPTFMFFLFGAGSLLFLAAVVNSWRKAKSNKKFIITAIVFTVMLVPFIIAFFVVSMVFVTDIAYIPIIILLVGIANAVLFNYLLKAPTVQGRLLMDKIEGFKEYLSTAEKDELNLRNPPDKTPELFEKYLPYALALGVESQWGAKFNDIIQRAIADNSYHPTWYTGASITSFSAASFAGGLSSSFSSAVSSSSVAPSSSGSGGGGFSGGGGGGGGGGGW